MPPGDAPPDIEVSDDERKKDERRPAAEIEAAGLQVAGDRADQVAADAKPMRIQNGTTVPVGAALTALPCGSPHTCLRLATILANFSYSSSLTV